MQTSSTIQTFYLLNDCIVPVQGLLLDTLRYLADELDASIDHAISSTSDAPAGAPLPARLSGLSMTCPPNAARCESPTAAAARVIEVIS
jgi:hypothetical protein